MHPFLRRRHFSFSILPTLIALTITAQAQDPTISPKALSVPDLVGQIATNNPETHFYEAEIASAKAGRRTAIARHDAELSLEVGRKRVHDAAGTLAGEGHTWSVSLLQTFEWPGRLGLRKAIANREVELAELGLARFKAALAGQARILAHGLHAANAKASAIREVAERFSALKEIFLAREPGGITPLLETRVIEAAELTLQRRATEAELAVQTALIELNQLRGAAPDEPLRVAALSPLFGDVPDRRVLLIAARENNFEFKQRQLELEQQGYVVRLARHERYPAFSLGPTVAHENAGERETVVGLSLNVPLPTGGRTRGAVDLADARRRQAEVAALLAERTLEKEVLIAERAFAAKSTESRRWSADTLGKFREAAELADRHYRLGAVPVATYVELQNSYLDAVEALLETERDTLSAALKLQELTGLEIVLRSPSS